MVEAGEGVLGTEALAVVGSRRGGGIVAGAKVGRCRGYYVGKTRRA